MDFKSLVWGANGGWVAQRVQCGRVKAKRGRRMKMRLLPPLVKAMCAMARCTSSVCMGQVTSTRLSGGKPGQAGRTTEGKEGGREKRRSTGEERKKRRGRERGKKERKGKNGEEKRVRGKGKGQRWWGKKLPGEAEAGTVRGETTGAFECRPRVFPVEGSRGALSEKETQTSGGQGDRTTAFVGEPGGNETNATRPPSSYRLKDEGSVEELLACATSRGVVEEGFARFNASDYSARV